jgi:mono/diheme cytochrome c family protein
MSKRFWRLILLVAAIVFILAACGRNPNPPLGNITPIPTLAAGATPTLVQAIQGGESVGGGAETGQANAAAGAAVYQKNCTPCHGVEGQGVDAPALRNNPFVQGNQAGVIDTISNGRPNTEMPAWLMGNGGPLSSGEITNVAAYLQTLQNVPPLPTATPQAKTSEEQPAPGEPARPSNAGGTGQAVSLSGDASRGETYFGDYCAPCHGPEGVQGVPNPGSSDETVPGLNPIDPTLVNSDPKTFAENIDLFIEHGSVPEGPAPRLMMPPFGDAKMLNDQQIADLIAYVIQLNQGK